MTRVLKRPRHGWARTRQERMDDALSGVLPLFLLFSFAAMLGIATFGSTITLLRELLGAY
jgi:hypothetical protein